MVASDDRAPPIGRGSPAARQAFGAVRDIPALLADFLFDFPDLEAIAGFRFASSARRRLRTWLPTRARTSYMSKGCRTEYPCGVFAPLSSNPCGADVRILHV